MKDSCQAKIISSIKSGSIEKKLLGFGLGPVEKHKHIYVQDCNPSVQKIAHILSRTHKDKYHVHVKLDSSLYQVRMCTFNLEYSLMEIALNAIESMPKGGNITFHTSNVQFLNHLHQQWKKLSPWQKFAQISITDNGHGMSMSVQKNMFLYNFTTKRSQNHSGKSLARVKKIVESLNGFIKVYSCQGLGTCFKIFFPVPQNGKKKKEFPYRERYCAKDKMVLLVDDESVFQAYAEKMLLKCGYKVMCAASAVEGMILYKINMKKIDVVLLDLTLPDKDIQHILNFFGQLNPNAKLIATVGVGEKRYFEQIPSELFSGFIQKPYFLLPLLRTIRKALNN